MKAENQRERREQIEHAAMSVLAEKGYRRTSMLQVAKRAKASNETLYAWYGSKEQLFARIIERNGTIVREHLENSLSSKTDPLKALETLGPLLLKFTASDKAIIINRAAIADMSETGILAKTIDDSAREILYPLIASLMKQLAQDGCFKLDKGIEDAADTYIALLFGETQFRQALGRVGALSSKTIKLKAARAFALTVRLYKNQ